MYGFACENTDIAASITLGRVVSLVFSHHSVCVLLVATKHGNYQPLSRESANLLYHNQFISAQQESAAPLQRQS